VVPQDIEDVEFIFDILEAFTMLTGWPEPYIQSRCGYFPISKSHFLEVPSLVVVNTTRLPIF
jgi:hypothetical protein